MKSHKNLLLFILINSLLPIALSQYVSFDINTKTKSILIGDKIVYIINYSNNNAIITYPKQINNTGYSSQFSASKDIIKKDETSFIIIGVNSNSQICHQLFIFENNNLNSDGIKCTGKQYNSISKIEGKYIKDNKMIIYAIHSPRLMLYLFTLNQDGNPDKEIELSSFTNNDYQITAYIKCDSFDYESFFCLYEYQHYQDFYNNYFWKMNYTYYNLTSDKKYSGNICNDKCLYGNLIKVNEYKNKYLICFGKIQTSTNKEINSIICQYYYFENGKINFGQSYDFLKNSFEIVEKSINYLNLFSYENTMFMQFNYKMSSGTSVLTRIIIFSPDLKINIHSDVYTSLYTDYDVVNLIINSTSINLLFEEQSKTNLLEIKFLASGKHLDLVLSNNNSYKTEFNLTREEFSMFSLNENINFYQNEEIIGMTGLLDLSSLMQTTKFYFGSKNNPGVFYNYFGYMNTFSSGIYSHFSLINEIIITVCYELCDDCIPGKVGNSTHHFCNKCIDGYLPIISDSDGTKGFNCYSESDPIIDNYYLGDDDKYYKCNDSCKNCTDDKNCISCNNNYYFLAWKNNSIKPGLCHDDIKEKYYLNNSANIRYKNLINKIVYKECYNTCLTCIGDGNYENNNCLKCEKNYTTYPFNTHQCTKNKDTCLTNSKYWKFEYNNIECINITECKGSIIIDGENRGRCVQDCNNFENPFITSKMRYYTLTNCGNQSYCIDFDKCKRGEEYGKFIIDYSSHICKRTTDNCSVNIFEDGDDPFIDDNITEPTTIIPIPTTIPPPQPSTVFQTIPKKEKNITDKENEILSRAKIWRMFNENKNYFNFNSLDKNLLKQYISLYKKESEANYFNNTGIYLVSTIRYSNYVINIYPLDIENFVYENIIVPNNLGFINFTEFFPTFKEYEVIQDKFIIIILLENKNDNSSINDLNYYFVNFDEENSEFNEIKLLKEESDLEMVGNMVNIIYPLKNYINNNSKLSKRNNEYLMDNIQNMNKIYPDIDLSNIDDPFYNDLCILFKTDYNTDMTLNDRRQEYYVNKALCENNCVLNQVINKDRETIKSLCKCEIKYNYTSNENEGKKDDIPLISSYNIKAFTCIKKTFDSQNISKNPIFWILLVIIIFMIAMILVYALYGNQVLKRMFKFGSGNINTSTTEINNKNSEIKIIMKDDNIENSKKNKMIESKVEKIEQSLSKISKIENKESIPSNENINIIANDNNENFNEDKNNIIDNNIKENNKIEFSKLELDKKVNHNSFITIDKNKEKIDIKKGENISYKYNPPKKKEEVKNESLITKSKNEEKDLISSDISLIKNNKDKTSEISFENISREKPIYIDNLINNGELLENNYLDFPLKFEKNILFEIFRDALDLSDEENNNDIKEIFNHFNTMEDFYIPEAQEKIKNKKINKRIIKKNPKITKLLSGKDNFIIYDKNYDSDNCCENNYYKKLNNNKIKSQENEEDTLFDNKLLLKNETNKKIIKKRDKNNDKNNDLFDMSKQNSENENSIQREKRLKDKKKKRKKFLEYLSKKDSENIEDSKYGKEEDDKNARLKTDFGDGAKLMIKSTLKYIGKDGLSSDENSSSLTKNINHKSFNSGYSEKNRLFGKNNLNLLNQAKDKTNRNELRSGQNRLLQFNEEEGYKGDKGANKLKHKKSKKKKQLKKRKIKNKKGEIEVEESEDLEDEMNQNKEKKSDFDIFYEKALGSSFASFLNKGKDKVIIEENLFVYYWKYFKKRELILVSFFDKKDTIPYFVRWSSFFFCLIFIFMLNCLFFFESNVHKRYINALEGKKNNIAFYFKHEFAKSIYVALISIVFKMIIIKLVLYRLFKIKKNIKKMMHHSYENNIETTELDDLEQKRYDYLVNYHIKLIIYFVLLILLSLFFGYICISYLGVFKESINAFFFGFLFSFIFSIIFCAVICFIIVSINKISRIFKNRCLLSTYVVLSTIY